MPDFPQKITRRSFALGAAVTATTALIPGEAPAQSSNPPPSSQASSATRLSPEAQAEVEMKVNEIFRKYGSRLSDQQKADIRKVMAETQAGLEKMRAFVLENGDQPATVLKFTEEEKKNARAE